MTSGVKTSSVVPGAVVPDGGWGWVVVFASFMIHFIMDGSVNLFIFIEVLFSIIELPIPWVISF